MPSISSCFFYPFLCFLSQTDADPSDNTDICYVDMERAPLSNHVRDGFAIYGGDDQDGEGAAHCHGFAWPSDPSDTRSRYIGNNLFFVSVRHSNLQ